MKLKEFLNNEKFSEDMVNLFLLIQDTNNICEELGILETRCVLLKKQLEENKKRIELLKGSVDVGDK